MSDNFDRQQTREPDAPDSSRLIALYESSCRHNASLPVYSCLGQIMTFAELDRLSRDFAAFLVTRLNLQKGDRIAVQLPNLIQYPVVAWAALRAGLIIVNTNPMYTARELLQQLTDSGARVLVMLARNQSVMETIISQCAVEHVITTHQEDMITPQPRINCELVNTTALPEALRQGAALPFSTASLLMEDLALLQYTGGTTGASKGSMLTHGNLFASMCQFNTAYPPSEERQDVVLNPMPIYHIYGFVTSVVMATAMGTLSVLIPDPRDIDRFIQIMCERPFTAIAGINTIYAGLMMHPDFDRINFDNLRYAIAGGAALMTSVAEEWYQRTGCHIYEGYALSETTSAACINTIGARQTGTVGKPVINTELKCVDLDGHDVKPEGEGELLIRGPQVMQGYWRAPQNSTPAIDEEGWFHTGDIAVLQADGFVRIVDRLKDMILVSGFNVYPNEIEEVVSRHPDVIECAVVGIPDEKTGEAVKLFVTTTSNVFSEDEIRAFCRESLTAYKVPKHVVVVEDLPKSTVGKILRRSLRTENTSA
ncbi:long-chain fatty acid--CoA ligase [Kineobactrum sediminis]|uniref:Long-chain-fatty-acid--CoA ligase n=1 Tax=Kineobactrum sediminis TaxID=1905677 RepID=A0A2N5XZ43_9GAMM|nr:AMP-binding protein [Kineobactrum sediminis]PLW81402.1 long-chain fatty acid--CoA ligase [Kineobactrum sediminis]